jgi:phospholipase D-like protein
VIKLELLFTVIVFGVWIFTLADVAQAPAPQIRNLPKVGWFIVVLLFPVLGSVAWFVLGRPEGTPRLAPGERAVPQFPEYDRRGRSAAADPEKDEEFLKQVRDRAEAQRKRYAEEKKRDREREEQRKQQREQQREPEEGTTQ